MGNCTYFKVILQLKKWCGCNVHYYNYIMLCKIILTFLVIQVLISYGCGYCVLYDMRCNSNQATKDSKADAHKRFFYEPGHSHVSCLF